MGASHNTVWKEHITSVQVGKMHGYGNARWYFAQTNTIEFRADTRNWRRSSSYFTSFTTRVAKLRPIRLHVTAPIRCVIHDVIYLDDVEKLFGTLIS